jgi:type II secretory pathway pseudopilin PulG
MRRRSASGFTLVEVAVALVMLAFGVLALVGSSAMATRMIGRGRAATLASEVATARVERLRLLAAATVPPCAHAGLAGGGAVSAGVGERWTVEGEGSLRRVTLALEYPAPGGPVSDTLRAVLPCRAVP